MLHRRLDDFQPISPAESRIISGLGSGEFESVGDDGASQWNDASRTVRAELLRFLILGGDEENRVHEKGLRVRGAFIVGVLDLEGCRVLRDIGLRDCLFEHVPVLRSAIVDSLFLDRSILPGLRAERLEARGIVSLKGATLAGPVLLNGARLGGSLEADGAVMRVPDGLALDADGLETRGGILLRGVDIEGGVNLSYTRLGGDVSTAGGSIKRPGEIALNGEGLTSRGDVTLKGAKIDGEVRLWGAQIGGNMDCTSSRLSQPGGSALSLNRARVEGVFFLYRGAKVDGALDLTACSITAIHDEQASWPGQGDLFLNRCGYGAFIHGPVDAKSRLEWLSRQPSAGSEGDFLPQPYEHLATVLREMGHEDDSRAVLIEKERRQRRARVERTQNPALRLMLMVKDGILAVTVRYGRQPLLAFVWLTLFWAVGALVFHIAQMEGALKPNSAVVLRSLEWTMCSVASDQTRYMPSVGQTLSGRALPGQSQLECFRSQPEAQSYPEFNPWMYSLDTLLPVTELGQKEFWRPNPALPMGSFALIYYYYQSVIGWSLSLLAVAGFSGLVKSR